MPKKIDPLEKVREIIASFPETHEKLSHGAPTFWGGKKTFATFHDGHYHDGVPALWIKAPEGAQEALIAADPDRFYRPKYVGPSGWVAYRLVKPDYEELRSLLVQGYKLVAPKRAIAKLEGD